MIFQDLTPHFSPVIFRKPEHENHLLEDSCHDISG
jgi:hypothetical protein